MILTDAQRDALIKETSEAIADNARTALIMASEMDDGRSDLFVMCRRDFIEQRAAALEFRKPVYIRDERGTFGFMRLRDGRGRVIGYNGDDNPDKDPLDAKYNPTDNERDAIAAIFRRGGDYYYYGSVDLCEMAGVVLTAYTADAVKRYERGRHRKIDIYEPTPNNSAVYMAIVESYFTQYRDVYDLPSLPAGTDARRQYYRRLIQHAAIARIDYTTIQKIPKGKGARPWTWEPGGEILFIEPATAYNGFVRLHGRGLPNNESEVDTDSHTELFTGATR